MKKMTNKWMSEHDLQSRLGGCLFRYRGEIVQVSVQSEDCLALYDPPGNTLRAKISPDDPDLDVSGLEVGYGNVATKEGVKVFFGQRSTAKNWKQGVSVQTIHFFTIDGVPVPQHVATPGRNEYILQTEGYAQSLLGDFPTTEWAREHLRTQSEIAVSRQVAFKRAEVGPTMCYIDMKAVGWLAPREDKVRVRPDQKFWLIERMLMGLGIGVCEE